MPLEGWLILLVIAVLVGLALDSVLGWRRSSRALKALQLETEKRAKRLTIGQAYPLTQEPLPTSLRLTAIDRDNQSVRGVLIVTLPSGADFKTVLPLNDWYRFTIIYQSGRRFLSPTWDFWRKPVRFDDFWDVEPENVDIDLANGS